MVSRSIGLLRDAVAIPSVNPMGRSDIDPALVGEGRLAEHTAALLRRIGLDAAVVGDGERRSVVAEATVVGASDTVMVASHLDTVPVDGMVIDPFDPVIESGRLHGRGSCDTKAGMAALIAALERVLREGRLRRNVIVVGEADEEMASLGVADVLAHLGSRRADWAIATEPTSLRIVTAHKGVAHGTLEARGRACHSSDPEAGRNAIMALARVLIEVERGAASLRARVHPKLGPATLSVGLIAGGQAPNIVPDAAHSVIDRRLLPDEDEATLRAELEAAIARAGVEGVAATRCSLEKPPMEIACDHPAVRACASVLRGRGLPAEPSCVAFGTDAGVLQRAGIPGLVLGPGSIAVAHTEAEYVPVDEVESMVEIFVDLLTTPGEGVRA